MPENSEFSTGDAPREVIFDGSRLIFLLLAMMIPFYFFGEWLFHFVWNHRTPLISLWIPYWVKAVSIVLCIFIHELIHGLLFAVYVPGGFKSVTFGFNVRLAAFYCHCNQPLRVKHYRKAAIAPLVILGLVPLLFAFISGIAFFKTFGLLFSIGGFGDLLIYIKLLKINKNRLVLDHPDKLGFMIMD